MRKLLAKLLTNLANRLNPELQRQHQLLTSRHARLAEAHARLVREIVAVDRRYDVSPEWTADDAAALRNFISTSTGQALARRFQAVAGEQAAAGCADVLHTAHSAGAAFGWQEACRWFDSLSRVARVQATKETEQAPEGEEQLLERMSP